MEINHKADELYTAFGITKTRDIELRDLCIKTYRDSKSVSEAIESIWKNSTLNENERVYSLYKLGRAITGATRELSSHVEHNTSKVTSFVAGTSISLFLGSIPKLGLEMALENVRAKVKPRYGENIYKAFLNSLEDPDIPDNIEGLKLPGD